MYRCLPYLEKSSLTSLVLDHGVIDTETRRDTTSITP